MKISFFIGPKERNITPPEPFEIPFGHSGHICSVMVFGDINKPKILIVPPMLLPAQPVSKYWFFMNISWSRLDGFEFNQYSDPEIANCNYLNSSPLNSNLVGKLRGSDKIQINRGTLSLIFRAEVNQSDLSDNDPKIFLEKCSEFGIRLAEIEFYGNRSFYKINCSNSQLYNVKFTNADLASANFCNSTFNNVCFFNSNLENADFTNSKFSKVEFSQARLREASFEYIRVTNYNKSRIENDETLIFINDCDLTEAKFLKAHLCSKFEDSNLSNTNFTEAKLVACRFYDCILYETIFSQSQFTSLEKPSDKDKSQKPKNPDALINCCIGSKPSNRKQLKSIISNCKFDAASMTLVDISNNIIKDTDFESTDLRWAQMHNCEFERTKFNGRIRKSANLSYANISFSSFKEDCNLNEVNLSGVKMIETKIEECEFVRSIFYNAKLRNSQLFKVNLTGADFRNADLTLVNFDKCKLHGANFYKSQRSGINLNIDYEKVNINNQEQVITKSTCYIDYIEWSPQRDGEIQIDGNAFLDIVSGKQAAGVLVARLFKDNPQFISNIYNQNQNQAAGSDLINAPVSVEGDIFGGDVSGAKIETSGGDERDDNDNNQMSEDLLNNSLGEEQQV